MLNGMTAGAGSVGSVTFISYSLSYYAHAYTYAHYIVVLCENYPAYLAYPTPNAMLNAQCIMLNGMPVKVR